MEFLEYLVKYYEKIDNIFDLTSLCYDFLTDVIKRQEIFIGKYIEKNEGAETSNQNLPMLEKFSEEIVYILKQQEEEGIEFEKCLEQIRRNTEKKGKNLQVYGNPIHNRATIPYFIIIGIDRYLQDKDVKDLGQNPLNIGYNLKSYIYANRKNHIFSEILESSVSPSLIRKLNIRNQLRSIIILEKKDLPPGVDIPPKIVHLFLSRFDKNRIKIVEGQRLRIAVIPYGSDKMLDFPVTEGALFTVKYKEDHQKQGVERANKLLEKAIDEKANIIIFPEFVCFEAIQKSIAEKLRDIYEENPDRSKALLFVIAGTRWSDNNNNICEIYSYDGNLIGSQYKYSSFSDLKNKGKEMVENLSDPGKEITILDIEGIGRVMLGICRDVSEGRYTNYLAENFCPQLLLVPAWSSSVDKGFRTQFLKIVSDNHVTSSILCNCCEAITGRKFKEKIGLVVTPIQNGSTFSGKVKEIKREKDCDQSCKKGGGCVFLIDLNFSKENFNNQSIVEHIVQKKVM